MNGPAPADTGPITVLEMVTLFGTELPIEAVDIIWKAKPGTTVGELRAQLRALAADKAPNCEPSSVFLTFSNDGHQIRKWSRLPFDGAAEYRRDDAPARANSTFKCPLCLQAAYESRFGAPCFRCVEPLDASSQRAALADERARLIADLKGLRAHHTFTRDRIGQPGCDVRKAAAGYVATIDSALAALAVGAAHG